MRRLKGPTNKSKYITVLFTKTTRIHSERILAVSPEILHTERDELALLFYKSVSIIDDFTVLWTPTVLTDKLDISLRPSKSTGQTKHDVLRDVIVQFFPCHMTYIEEPKFDNVTN